MRILSPLLLASSLVLVPLGIGHAQPPPADAPAPPTAASAPPASDPATSAPAASDAPAAAAAPTGESAPASPGTAPGSAASAPATAASAPTGESTAPTGKSTAPTGEGAAPAGSAEAGGQAPVARRGIPPLRTQDAVAGGAGIASILVGAVLVGVATGIQADLRSSTPKDLHGNLICGATGETDVLPVTATPCAGLRDQARLGTDLGNAGVAFLVAGGLLTGAAAAYWLISSPSPAPAARSGRNVSASPLRVVPSVGATGGGVVVVGSF